METGPDISEAISYNGRICQADEITRQAEIVISDDKKQLQKGEKIEAVEEAGIEITEVEEINKRAIPGNKNHDTVNVTGTSSQMAKIEEENLNIEGHETLKDERVHDQHVEVISNQQASTEEIPQSTEKEMKEAQKEEERETVVDKDTLAESSEEVISILEATAVQTSKASVHTKDLTVNNLNKDVETVTDLCTKDETIDKSSTADTTLFQEGLGETKLKGVEYKETEKYSDLVAEEKGPETIRPSEEIGNKEEKDKVMYDRIEDASFSTKEGSSNIQNDEGTTLDIGDGDKDKPEKSSVILEQCRASQQEDGLEVGEKIKDACSAECEEKKQDATKLNKQEKDVTSVEDEMQNKNRLDTPFVTEETCQQEVDNSEIFKVDPKIGLENIVMESTKEVTNPNEIFEKFAQADSSASENSKDVENYDKKPDASSGTCEDGMQSKAEDLDVTEALAGETREKEGFTVMVNEDNISKTDFSEAMKLSKLESKEHEGGPEDNLLQQNEPEKEEFERPSNKISEEIETGASRENTKFENPEDSFKEKRQDDKSTATYDTNSVDIPGQKNPSLIDSNEKTESSEAEIPNNNANNLHVTHSLVEETGQVQGKRIDEVFEFEPEEEIQKSICTSTDEENQAANVSEAYKSTEGTVIEHSSAEGTIRMETNITEKLETVYGLESDEKLEVSDAQANIPEVTHKEEAIVTGNYIEEGSLENDRTKVAHSVYTGDKTVEQSLPVRSLTEPAPTLSGEEERSNITLEEVHDGHKIPVPGSGDVNKEQIFEANATFFTPKPIEKETTKIYQDIEKETKISREEDGSLEIMKEGQVNELSPESIGKGPIQDFKEEEKKAHKDEILEKSQPARAGESIAHETNHDESQEEILHASLAKQEEGLQGEVEHLVSTEASAENGDEDTSSVKVTEDNNDNNNIGLAKATGNSAKVTPQGEEDSEEGLQVDETASIVVESPENILIASLVKQKEDLQEEGEKLDSTEASIKNNNEETYSIKMAEENDENNKLAETKETSVKVTPKGEEDSEHALQHDEPRETKHEFESPGEVLDTSLVNPGKGLQGESTNLAQAETSQEKRDEGISSVKVVVDNDRLAETTENSAKATPEGEEDSDQILQKDEPGEGITHETNNGAELLENISDPTLVTQEEGLQGESENLAPTEAAIEKRDEDTSYIKVTEDNDDNEQAEGTENSEKVTPEGGEDSEKILQIDEPGQSIVGMENRNVDSPEGGEDSEHALQHDEPRETNHESESPGEVLDTSLVGKGLQGESTNLAPAETSQEKRDEGISSVKIVVDNDRLVENTENSAKATPEEDEEDSDQILQKDEPAEGITHETNNGVVSDPTLVKQEKGLQGESENLAPRTEAAIDKREKESYIKVTEDNDDNEQAEGTESSEKVTPEGGEDSEKILQIDEPGKSIVGMENRNVDSPEGEEDSEQALQHDKPRETNCEFESPGEILDTSLVNPGKGLQGESTNLAQAETSQEKRDEAFTSVKVVVDNDDNDKLAEATENSAKATPEGEENSEQILQKDEPAEGITHETNNGAEILETNSDPPLVKQEEGLQEESENLAPTEAAIEKRDEDTSYNKVVEDNDDKGQAEATENSEKVTPEGGEDSEKILQINEPGQNIVGMENRNVDSTENNLDTLFVKQEEVLQGEGYNSAPTKTSIENSDEDTFAVKVAEDKDENNRLAETTEDSVNVTPKGEENSEQVLQKDDPQEKYHNVESPDNILDKSLLNLEEDLHVDGEDLAPKEASIENKDEDSSLVKVAEHKDGNNRQDEARENNADGTPKGEEHVLQKDAVDESIACGTDHEVEKHEKALNTTLAKQEECLQGQDENMIPTEASIEKRDGEMSSMKIAEGNDGINGVAEAEGNSVKETAKGEEELELVFQRDANEKLEQVLDVRPEEMEAESSSKNMKKTTCMKEEGIIQNVEETSETEKREETETTDDKKEKEAARKKTFDATTSIDKGNRELISEEIDSVKDQSPEFNEKETTEENSKDQQECRGLGTTASSIEEEKPNLEEPGIAELSSSSVGEVIVKELREEVKGPNLEFIEQTGAKDLTEESKSGTLKDSEEPNKNFSTLIIAETSSCVPDIFEKMIKEQILKQEEHINNDFDSASVIILSEETGLKEAKPENNEQVKSSDIATEGPATTETDRSNLVNVDIDVQPEKISSLEENRNKGILTIEEGGGEKNEHQMEDKAPTTGIGHEVEVTTAEKPLDSVSEDSFQNSYMTPLKDHEPMIIELSRMVEETLARDETTYANAKTPSRVKETNENLTQKEDESIKSKDVSELFSSDDGKEGVNEEVQKHKDGESHMLPKIQNEKKSYDAEDADISKRGETSDSADQTKVFNTTSVSKRDGEHILEETDIVKDQSPAFNEKETTEENSKDDQESGGFETKASYIETEQPNLEEPNITELSSLSVGEVTVKENLKEDESSAMKLKEEVKSPDLEFIEQIGVKDLTEESKSGTLQDSAERYKNITLTSEENSSFVPEVSEKETKEEILKQEHTNYDFDCPSVTVLCEETGLKEAKPENYEQVKSSDIAPEGKGPATIETEETNLDNVDIDVQPEEISGLEQNRNKEISTVADGGGEKIEHQMEKEEPPRGIGHEVEVTTTEKPIDSISEDSSRDSYVMPLKDHEPITIVVSKTVEETPEKDVIADVNAKTPSSVQETDEKLIQKEDEPIKSKDVSELFSSDDGKEDANEKVQKLKDAESQMPPELHGEKNSYDTEDLEISQRGETSDLADQTEVSKLDTSTHENPSNEASKDIAISTCKDSEKATLEQEDSVQNLEGSLKGDLVEKGTAELNAGAHSHECEPTNTKDNDQIAEKNLESADLGQKPDFVSESTNKDQSDDTLPQTNKNQTEENKDDVQEWNSESVEQKNKGQIEGETEKKMEMEPKLEVKDHIHESQKAKDTITAVSTTEKVHDGVKKVNGSEDIREHAIDGDSDVKEIHTVSTRDEIAEKEKDSGPESTEYLKTIDSEEHTETTNKKIEDPTGETETPVTKAPEEEKKPDESGLEPADVHKGVEDIDESESTREQAIEGESNLKEIHTILAKDEILEKEKDYGLESTECLKASYSKEQTETVNTNIEEDPTVDTKVLITEATTEVKILNEDGLEPVEEHEGVEKVNESENIIEQAEDRKSDLKETHAIFARDEILEEVKDCGPDSIEYVKTTDSKGQIETVNTDTEKDPIWESEAPVTKAPEEEKIQDEGILKPKDERKGVDKTDESENIREEATDGDSGLKEIHTVSVGQEIVENVEDSGPKSIEYLKATDSKEQTKTVNKNIEKVTTREVEELVTRTPEEGSLKPEEAHEEVEKINESKNIIEQAIDGESGLEKIHTSSVADEILEKVNDSGLESIEYLKETDCKEQIETLNTDIEKVTLEETEALVIKAPEEQKIQDEGSLITADLHEGVEQVAESENIIQQNKDGENDMEEIHTGSTRHEIFENVKESGPKSTEYPKETNSKEQTKAANMDVGEDTTGEAEGLVKIAEVHEEVKKVNESKNIIEQVKNGESSLKEIRTRSTGDEILEKMNDSGPDSTEYPKATDSKEQIITVNKNIEGPTGETEAPITKAPEEEEMQDEGILKPADVHEGFEKVDESVRIRQQAIEGESDLIKIHTISTGYKILENIKDSGSESNEYIKATYSMEHTETKNMDIKEDPTWEAEVPFIKEPKEENTPDEGSLNPTEAQEGVEKVHESENNIEQPVDGVSDLKEIHTKKSIGDEMLEKDKNFGPESIEYLKETDSKKHIETLNTNFEKDSSSEPEALVTKVPAEEKIQDEGSLNTADAHEGVEQVADSENIIQQNPDVEHYSQEIHTGSTEDEILMNVENSGPKSIDIKEDTRKTEASLTKEPKEEKIQDEGSLNPTDGHEGVEKVDRSENIREYAIAEESNLKEIHTTFVGDEILEKVKDSDLKSTEYHRATDSKEQIETVNTDIEEHPIQEMEAPITKAPEEEKIQDEDSLKPAHVHEGVEKANGSENIKEQAIDGESGLKEIYTISVGDGILEKDKDFGPESTKYLKETKSEQEIATVNTNIEEDPIGETEATVTKAQEEEKIQDEGSLKAVDGHEGVEKADGSANNREQVIDGESDFKEIHEVSLGDDTLNKVKYCSPESTVYIKATDSEEHIGTVNTTIKEDPIEETEVPATRALEEEEEEKIQDEGHVKPTNVSVTVTEDEEEKIKEDIKVEVDNFPDNANNAIVIPVESSLGEAQMDDKPVKDTSSDESLKTINAEPCPHAEEVGSTTPEKTSFSLVSQLPNMKHNYIETETVTPEKPDADEETKTVSDAVFQSKYHGVEETNETGQSLRVENLDADRTEEGIKEASGTVLESKSLGTEAVTIDENTADQNLPAGKLEEQLQTPSSKLLSWEQEHGPTTIVNETEAIKTKEGEILDEKNISDSSATKATEGTCLQKEEQPETPSSTFFSTEQEHRTTTTFKKTEEENIKEVEMLDEKGINNSSAIKATEEACLKQEEPKELAVSKLGLLDGASKLETADKEECKKIKELTSPIKDASNLSFETSEKSLETMLDVHSREALINSEEEIQDEGIVKPEGVSITVAKDSFEYIKEEIKVDNIGDKTENATAEVVTAEPSSVEAQLNDKSTEDTISDDRVKTSTRESKPPAEEVASMKLEKTSSNLPSQLLNVATKNEEKESETLENPDANEVEETKTASDAVFESKYEGVKETGETGGSLKVEKLDAADIEEMKETSEISSKSKALGLVEVSEDEVIADQTLPAGNLGEQIQPSSSFLSREEQHGTTITVKRTEEENMKEVKTPSGEVQKQEGSTLDQASKVEPHVKEEIKYADSPLETDEIINLTRPIPSNLNFGTTEKAFNYVSEVQSHEVLTKSEDINEKHLQTAMPDLNTEESESQCKKTVEANKISRNKVSIEEVTEEQEFAKDAKSVSLGEETIIESHQGYESKSEEYPAEETNKTYKATTDAHQHEALRLPEIIDEGNVSEDIAKTIQVEDRTVDNENAAESYLDKVQVETVKEAAMKLDLENKSGDTNFTKATTEFMALKEKGAGIEILQKEGTLGIAEVKEITQNIHQLETTSYAASETKIPGEECPRENTGTIITTAYEDVQPVLQHPIDKALEKVELKDTRPGKTTEADAEVREVECEGEKRIGDLGEILTEKSTSEDSAKISLSHLMHRSKKENLQVTKDLTKEREPVPSKEEMQNQEAETTVDETKTDKEAGDEHKRTDTGYDALVMVETAKDIDVKVVHKKHNILSGVGSKVKHSLSKVKKAITGKSSHPKTTSPK
ncbi:hypothetical protein SO802_001453 [Lithocarpus litseifolius]|uniref:Titin-like n=1 Tax=Lithocarpus litseifolius TaxID=425828 RepID=A0AAW2DW93_9ROSI